MDSESDTFEMEDSSHSAATTATVRSEDNGFEMDDSPLAVFCLLNSETSLGKWLNATKRFRTKIYLVLQFKNCFLPI